MRSSAALVVLLAAPAFARATAAAPPPRADDAPTVVVVVGAEGSPEYGPQFARWADRWVEAAGRRGAEVLQVGRDTPAATTRPVSPTTAPATSPVDGSDRERLRTAIARASADAAGAARPLWLVLIGHGTFDGREAKFNLRGPDVSDLELADWLRPVGRPTAVIDCSSSSAPFVNRLSASGRVVITATRSGQEIHFARFGEHLAGAIADPSADLDKSGQTSLLEAFLAASHRVEEFYKQEGRLATEHALLDDNGDQLGTPADFFQGVRATKAAKNGAALDGARAHQWHLVLSDAERAMPAELRARRDELELSVEALRSRKASMGETQYYSALEPLLLELARVYQQSPRAD